jgi:SAM-dependent methyltransferase
MDFNQSKGNYRELIDESISFIGKDVEFFTKLKANFLKHTIRKFSPNLPKPQLLDIGCGHGFIHSHLSSDSFDIVGVETASEVLELARSANPKASYLSYDGKTLPFDNGTFDVAITICVMHHVPPEQWTSFLFEMRRVLKPDGIAIVFEHNPYNPVTLHVVSRNILDADAVLLSSPKLKKLMLQAGFNKVGSRFIFFTPFSPRIFRWIDKMLWWCPFGAQYYSVATN